MRFLLLYVGWKWKFFYVIFEGFLGGVCSRIGVVRLEVGYYFGDYWNVFIGMGGFILGWESRNGEEGREFGDIRKWEFFLWLNVNSEWEGLERDF